MFIKQIKLPTQSKDRLSRLKGRTGIQSKYLIKTPQNTGCGVFCMSDRAKPAVVCPFSLDKTGIFI